MDATQAFPLPDLTRVLQRRARAMALTAGVVFLAALALAALLPSRYEAETTLLIEPQAISSRLVEGNLAASDLNSRLHLMTMQILSRARLSRVIDELSLYAEESRQLTREEVIELMHEAIRVEPVLPELERGSLTRKRDIEINTFRLFFRHESPQTAADVANRLANDFIDEHIRERVQISADTAEFIESERARLAEQIGEVEAQTAHVKGQNVGQLPEDLLSNQRLLERAMDGLRAAERELAQASSDAAFYHQQALTSAAVGGLEDPLSPMRRLRLLELQLAEYQSRGFTEKHPDVIASNQEIAALRQQLAGADGGAGEPVSLLQQHARAEQRRAALRAQAAGAEVERLKAQIEGLQERLAATPRVAEQLDALQREYDHLFTSFQEFSSKRLSAAVAANMDRRQKGEQFRVLEVAYPPTKPASPNRPLILLLGAMLGLALGGGVGLLRESMDTSFHDARELQGALGLPVLVAIPAFRVPSDARAVRRWGIRSQVAVRRARQGKQPAGAATPRTSRLGGWLRRAGPARTGAAGGLDARCITLLQPRSFAAEQFRTLRAQIDAVAAERPLRRIAVTSALAGEGKTAAAVNLALVTALGVGRRVLLVDCDLRQPKVHTALGLRPEAGLAEVLADRAPLGSAVLEVKGVKLDVLPVAAQPPNPSELLACDRMRSLLEELTDSYERIIFDTPATLAFPDAKTVSELSDGLVLVVRADATPRDDVLAALDVLGRGRVLGTVLNGASVNTERYGY